MEIGRHGECFLLFLYDMRIWTNAQNEDLGTTSDDEEERGGGGAARKSQNTRHWVSGDFLNNDLFSNHQSVIRHVGLFMCKPGLSNPSRLCTRQIKEERDGVSSIGR